MMNTKFRISSPFLFLKTEVMRVEKADDFDTTGDWVVTTKDLKTEKTRTNKYNFVMVCNGHLTEPNRPHIPGLDKFRGKVLHTHEYKVSAEHFRVWTLIV